MNDESVGPDVIVTTADPSNEKLGERLGPCAWLPAINARMQNAIDIVCFIQKH